MSFWLALSPAHVHPARAANGGVIAADAVAPDNAFPSALAAGNMPGLLRLL